MYRIIKAIMIVSAGLFALFGVSIYFAMSPVVLQRFLLFHPTKVQAYREVPAKVLGARTETLTFRSPTGRQLRGIFFEKPHANGTVLFHHGQGGNVETSIGIVKAVLLAGYSVFAYDYEGYGMSEGSPSTGNLIQAGQAAYDFLENKKCIKGSSIIQLGASLGTGVASAVAASRPSAAVILIGPYTSLTEVAKERIEFFAFYPDILFPKPELGSLPFVRDNKNTPVLLIHGDKDQVISVEHSRRLFKIASSPCSLVVKIDGNHGNLSTVFMSDQIRKFLALSAIANHKSLIEIL